MIRPMTVTRFSTSPPSWIGPIQRVSRRLVNRTLPGGNSSQQATAETTTTGTGQRTQEGNTPMATTYLAPPITITARSRLRAWIGRHPLLVFFALTYGLTWPYMVVEALGSWNMIPFRLPFALFIPMGYGPTFAALIV